MSEFVEQQGEKFFTLHKLWWWFVYTTMMLGVFGLATWAMIVVQGYDWAFDLIPPDVPARVRR